MRWANGVMYGPGSSMCTHDRSRSRRMSLEDYTQVKRVVTAR